MAKFTHYFIYGNASDDFSPDKLEEWGATVPKKYNMELVWLGVSYGTSEDFLVILKGNITDFEKMYTIENVPPIVGVRSHMGGSLRS